MKESVENLIWKVIHKLSLNVTYKSKTDSNQPWAFISYIPESCYRNNITYLNRHQNRREMKQIVDVFKELGYNVYVQHHSDLKLPTSIKPAIIFGLEPCFEEACEKWPDALKIYYATGAYWRHQNDMIKKRTDAFNSKYGTAYPYQRLVTETSRCENADYIFQIGTKFTIDTYPEHLRNKLRIIRQSNTLLSLQPREKDFSNKTDFLWLGSSGTILKGLDLTIEYFKLHPELSLHVVGSVDDEFKRILQTEGNENIHFYGFVNTSSELFQDIVSKCNFLIYPSCTEGGCPGAVINSMYYGVIPVVTPWAAIDDINKLGFLLDDMTVESIDKAVTWANNTPPRIVRERSHACRQYILDNYSLSIFKNDMLIALKKIIINNAND